MERVNGVGDQKEKVGRGKRVGVWPVEVRSTALQREHRGLKSMCC